MPRRSRCSRRSRELQRSVRGPSRSPARTTTTGCTGLPAWRRGDAWRRCPWPIGSTSRGDPRSRARLAIRTLPDLADAVDPRRSPSTSLASAAFAGPERPMLRDRQPIGALTVDRADRRGFRRQGDRLLQTFADQAVIAIENVRLFNETKEALEQQTATAEVLQRDQQLGGRCAAGVRQDPRQLPAPVRNATGSASSWSARTACCRSAAFAATPSHGVPSSTRSRARSPGRRPR